MYFDKFRWLNYFTSGLRIWSNQLPMRFDSYSGNCSNRCLYCTIFGSKISTPSGQVEIQDIKIGDEVISTDIKTTKSEVSTVLQTMSRETDEIIYSIETSNNKIEGITGEHPVFTQRGWIQVKKLTKDNYVHIQESKNVFWEKIQKIEKRMNKGTVYNIETSPNNNYFVDNVLVHNCYSDQLQDSALKRCNIKPNPRILKMGNYKRILKDCMKIFDEGLIDIHSYTDHFLWKHGIIENGTMGDPFMEEEKDLHITYNLMSIAQEYGIPLYFNTKANALKDQTIFDKVCDLKKTGGLMDISVCALHDSLLKRYEPKAPLASERIQIATDLTDNGLDVVISARPIIAGVSDLNFEEYIERLCHTGASSLHLRTLIITGKHLQRDFWKDFAKNNDMYLKHVSYRYSMDYFMDLFDRAKDIANGHGVHISASHTLFYEHGAANKCDYKKTSKVIREGLFHPGITDILSKSYKHKEEPQLLTYDNTLRPYLKKDTMRDFMEKKFKMDSYNANLIWSSSCVRKVPNAFLLSGRDIINKSMWDGWESGFGRINKIRPGYVSIVHHIYALVDEKTQIPILDDNKHMIYAYIPKDIKLLEVPSTHPIPTSTTNVEELQSLGVW